MLNQIDLSRADLNLLVLFETVLAERHVGRAAERLNLTPSAVSHGLGRLRRLLHDPVFLRTPKGVAPTARALELAGPVAETLAQIRRILATAAPFDPATSTRRFVLGAPDAIAAVVLPPLLARLRDAAPGLDLGLRQLLPARGETAPGRAWRAVFAELDARTLDAAIIPSDAIPARFSRRTLYEEDFVVALRAGHPAADALTPERYLELGHLVVSVSGDPHGIVDRALAAHGLARRTALTVPDFLFALAVLAETDLVAALPRRFAAAHAARFGVVAREAPYPPGRFRMNLVAPEAALTDAGLLWLLDRIAGSQR